MIFSDQLDQLQTEFAGRYETELELLRHKATPIFDETFIFVDTRFRATPTLSIEWLNCLGEHYPVLRIDLEGQTVRWSIFNCHKCEDPDDDGSELEEREFDLWAHEGWDYVLGRLDELAFRRTTS